MSTAFHGIAKNRRNGQVYTGMDVQFDDSGGNGGPARTFRKDQSPSADWNSAKRFLSIGIAAWDILNFTETTGEERRFICRPENGFKE